MRVISSAVMKPAAPAGRSSMVMATCAIGLRQDLRGE